LPRRPHRPPTYSRGVTSMVLLDANKEAEKSYQIAYTPTVFLVDRQGQAGRQGDRRAPVDG